MLTALSRSGHGWKDYATQHTANPLAARESYRDVELGRADAETVTSDWLYDRIDVDKSGQLSKEEVIAAVGVLGLKIRLARTPRAKPSTSALNPRCPVAQLACSFPRA